MDRYYEIKTKILDYSNKDEDIKAIVAIGSSTRKEIKADEFSDLDLFVVTNNTERWLTGDYPNLLGNVSISFVEPTLGGGKERRCIYDEDKDVDMIIMTPEQFETAVKEGVAEWVMNRGYDVLYDSVGFDELLKTYIRPGSSAPDIDEAEFLNIVNDFYFHNIWAFKKLKRGELWTAKMCVDAYLKNHLLKMMEVYRYKTAGVDVWHAGRFIEKWAGDEILDELKKCFSHYEEEDVKRALLATCRLFEIVSRGLADAEDFVYPEKACKCAKAFLNLDHEDGVSNQDES